jgi:Domain of unknown function (DUF4126)
VPVPCRYLHAAAQRKAHAAQPASRLLAHDARTMSLFLDIGQGAGLAGASGIRPFLPPLLAGALARGDIGVDFDDTGWRFLEAPGFLLAVFALAVLWYAVSRSGPNRSLELVAAVIGLTLGGLLFAGSLAEGGNTTWPGIVAGVACAALAWASVGALFERARRRLGAGRQGAEAGSADLLSLYAEGIALALAGLAIALPPVSFLALIAFVVLLVRGRRDADSKYAGLRVLR